MYSTPYAIRLRTTPVSLVHERANNCVIPDVRVVKKHRLGDLDRTPVRGLSLVARTDSLATSTELSNVESTRELSRDFSHLTARSNPTRVPFLRNPFGFDSVSKVTLVRYAQVLDPSEV